MFSLAQTVHEDLLLGLELDLKSLQVDWSSLILLLLNQKQLLLKLRAELIAYELDFLIVDLDGELDLIFVVLNDEIHQAFEQGIKQASFEQFILLVEDSIHFLGPIQDRGLEGLEILVWEDIFWDELVFEGPESRALGKQEIELVPLLSLEDFEAGRIEEGVYGFPGKRGL